MPTTGLTYDDLLELFPEESLERRELIGGELFVTPSPERRHQRVVVRLTRLLEEHAEAHGGELLVGPFDLQLTPHDVVQPDLLYFIEERRELIGERPTAAAPDLVVEISSPSTRQRDLTAKRRLYEREGVTEYWFVDLDGDRVLVHRLSGGGYGAPLSLGRQERLGSPLLPSLSIVIAEVLGEA